MSDFTAMIDIGPALHEGKSDENVCLRMARVVITYPVISSRQGYSIGAPDLDYVLRQLPRPAPTLEGEPRGSLLGIHPYQT